MSSEIKMTKLAKCAGCGAKVGAGTLSELLGGLPVHKDENLIVGYDTNDDAAVYKISDDLVIVQTLDFFPPIVDDPYTFGKIAAANALSDIFAMGAEAKLAMNILCVSTKMEREHVHELLRGGYEKVYEAGAVISGGHTIQGEEPKYGLSVTGFAHPKKFLRNSSAKEGDILILTKPLGIGIITTAHKANMANEKAYNEAIENMCMLNKTARDIMMNFNINSCTDVTGFGLLGHSCEMAEGSGNTIEIFTDSVPYLEGVHELAEMGILPEGMYRNREFAESRVFNKANIDLATEDILYDPQTSGGLLISVPEKESEKLLSLLKDNVPCAKVVGQVVKRSEYDVILGR